MSMELVKKCSWLTVLISLVPTKRRKKIIALNSSLAQSLHPQFNLCNPLNETPVASAKMRFPVNLHSLIKLVFDARDLSDADENLVAV